jgi:hypothetical protein
MPDLLHERKESKVLFETLSNEMNLAPVVVEKDYWVMHCLWGLLVNDNYTYPATTVTLTHI